MNGFHAIIFDFNGVLWWDNRLQEEAWRAFSRELRGEALTPAEMVEHVHGRNNRYTLGYLSDKPLDDRALQLLSERKEGIYRRLCLELGDQFRLSPGAEPLLNFLARARIPRTIATASGWSNMAFFIGHLGLARWFDPDRIVHDDGKLAGKPAPDFYLVAAGQLGLAPALCVVVEDSLSGIRAAAAAGVGRIYALVGDSGHAPPGDIPADVRIIRDLSLLPRDIFQ